MNFTLGQVIQHWFDHLSTAKASPTLRKHLNSALRLYLLERLGYKTRDMSLSEFSHFLTTISLESFAKSLEKASRSQQQTNPDTSVPPTSGFLDLAEVAIDSFQEQFDQAVEAQQTKRSTGNNYRSALKRFLQWLSTHPYWKALNQEAIPQIAPRRLRNRHSSAPSKKRFENYGLKESALSALLRQELEAFQNFRRDGGDAEWRQIQRERRKTGQQGGRRPQIDPITSAESLNTEKEIILRFFGWQVQSGQTPLEQLQLDSLADPGLIEDYTHWLVTQRNCSHEPGVKLLSTGIALLKWRNFPLTRWSNWSGIDAIEVLKEYRREFQDKYKLEHKKNAKTKWKVKALTHEQLQQICDYLKSLCADCTVNTNSQTGKPNGKKKRSDSAIVWSWQTYLIVALLTYAPVRQQELRQYKYQVNLVRRITEDGKAVYIAQNIHHKNAKCSDDTREYQLPEILTPALDAWIQKYRPLAIKAVQSLDNWLRFAGYQPDELEKLNQRLTNAQQGIIPSHIKDIQTYVKNLQRRISIVESRIAAWPAAKMNIESNHLFFCSGKCYPKSFGNPLSRESVYSIVQGAVAEASLALFQRECRLGPHSFRHIAAAHVRRHRGDKTTLALLMGHDEDMGDEYAAQLQDDISLTALADNWWLYPNL